MPADLEAAPRRVVREPARSRDPFPKTLVRKTPRVRSRGVPPPASFDLDALAESQLLTVAEVAALLRVSIASINNWRLLQVDHPLKWRRISK